jgi:16S rRNA (uracil1498-N3)-methyltransferase
MHRFYLPPAQCETLPLLLTGREAHHGVHVLRIRAGEQVAVLDGVGHEFLCEVQDCGRDKIRLGVVEKKWVSPPPWQITLMQAVPKGKIIESIIQKATELGAARIVPLLSERVVMHLDENDAADKGVKWQLVAIEAIKQCGAAWLPKVETPMTLAQFFGRKEQFELPLVGSLQGDGKHPRQYFEAFRAQRNRQPETVCVWVGPEGDFTPAELDAIRGAGALPITLGPLVLRSETAAVYCLSILNYELHGV